MVLMLHASDGRCDQAALLVLCGLACQTEALGLASTAFLCTIVGCMRHSKQK
jgi:hypothetical protein